MAGPKPTTDVQALRDLALDLDAGQETRILILEEAYKEMLRNPSTNRTSVQKLRTPQMLAAQTYQYELEIHQQTQLTHAAKMEALLALYLAYVQEVQGEAAKNKAFAELLLLEKDARNRFLDEMMLCLKGKSTKTPAITMPSMAPIMRETVYDVYEVTQKNVPKIKSRFSQWLENNLDLAKAKFELFFKQNTMQVRSQGVATPLHQDKLAEFLQQLRMDGLMGRSLGSQATPQSNLFNDNLKAAEALRALGDFPPPASPTESPKPKLAPGAKRTREEEERVPLSCTPSARQFSV